MTRAALVVVIALCALALLPIPAWADSPTPTATGQHPAGNEGKILTFHVWQRQHGMLQPLVLLLTGSPMYLFGDHSEYVFQDPVTGVVYQNTQGWWNRKLTRASPKVAAEFHSWHQEMQGFQAQHPEQHLEGLHQGWMAQQGPHHSIVAIERPPSMPLMQRRVDLFKMLKDGKASSVSPSEAKEIKALVYPDKHSAEPHRAHIESARLQISQQNTPREPHLPATRSLQATSIR